MAKMLKSPVHYRGPNFEIVENPGEMKLINSSGIGSFLPWRPEPTLVVARQVKAYRGRLDDMTTVDGSVAVSSKFRDLVESFEPGVHTFVPIILERKNGELFDEYFLFAAQQDVDCIITDNRPNNFEYLWTSPETGTKQILCTLTQFGKTLQLSKSAIAGKHLWTAGLLGLTELFISDAFHAALKRSCLGYLDDDWVTVEEVDRVWIAEQQMGPLLPRHKAYVASGRTTVDWTLGEIWEAA